MIEYPFTPSLGRCYPPIAPSLNERAHGLRNDHLFCLCPIPNPSTVRWFGFTTGECATCSHPIEGNLSR